MTYGAFLACLGVIACGLSFLETSANTYSACWVDSILHPAY